MSPPPLWKGRGCLRGAADERLRKQGIAKTANFDCGRVGTLIPKNSVECARDCVCAFPVLAPGLRSSRGEWLPNDYRMRYVCECASCVRQTCVVRAQDSGGVAQPWSGRSEKAGRIVRRFCPRALWDDGGFRVRTSASCGGFMGGGV